MNLRPYCPADCPHLADLFRDTIYTINAKDYTKPQLDAWTSGAADLSAWERSLSAHITLVAMEGEKIVGFGDIDKTGYLDRLFVHKDHQGQGIAAALCDALETAADAPAFTAAVSLTARPFFEHRGYRILQEQQVERHGILLRNFWMRKEKISDSAENPAKKPLHSGAGLL